MTRLKQVVWFCFAGACCAILLLVGSDRVRFAGTIAHAEDGVEMTVNEAGTPTGGYCPVQFMGIYQGQYWYLCHQTGDCGTPYYVPSYSPHLVGGCPNCPDPIVSSLHPLSALPEVEPELTPTPDPAFSGVLR